MTKALLSLAAVLAFAASPAVAARGTVKSFDVMTRNVTITPDGGGQAVSAQYQYVPGVSAPLAAGTRVEYAAAKPYGYTITNVLGPAPKPAPAPAPVPAPGPAPTQASNPAAPTGTVKTFDAGTRQGTLTPASGGRDLYFGVDAATASSVKVGGKVKYVEAMVVGSAP